MAGLLSFYHVLPPQLQNVALSAYGLLIRRVRYGRTFHQTLARLEGEEVDPFLDQSERLLMLLTAAAQQTEHYRKVLSNQSLALTDINLDNFTEVFPVLEKSSLRSNPSAFYNNNFGKASTTMLKTSGTTGTPLDLLVTKHSRRENYAFFNYFLHSIGIDEFDRSATLGGRLVVSKENKTPPFWRKNYSMNTLFCSAYHISEETIPSYIRALEEWQPVYIDSYPSAIYEIASFINFNKIKHKIHLKAVVTSSETLGGHQRNAIEKAFQCSVIDQYGCAEMAVMANQQKDGQYHIPPQYAIAEVLDDNDRPVKPGESGHLVCTGLLNQAMPLIRYRIGDIVKTSSEQVDGYPYIIYLDSIEGRDDDVITTSSGFQIGRLSPATKGVRGVAETQIIQKTQSSIQVNLVVSAGYTKDAEVQMCDALQERLGAEMHVQFKYLDSIPREKNGKFKSVKSELG